jgi:CheY-like chemotaxis protein
MSPSCWTGMLAAHFDVIIADMRMPDMNGAEPGARR